MLDLQDGVSPSELNTNNQEQTTMQEQITMGQPKPTCTLVEVVRTIPHHLIIAALVLVVSVVVLNNMGGSGLVTPVHSNLGVVHGNLTVEHDARVFLSYSERYSRKGIEEDSGTVEWFQSLSTRPCATVRGIDGKWLDGQWVSAPKADSGPSSCSLVPYSMDDLQRCFGNLDISIIGPPHLMHLGHTILRILSGAEEHIQTVYTPSLPPPNVPSNAVECSWNTTTGRPDNLNCITEISDDYGENAVARYWPIRSCCELVDDKTYQDEMLEVVTVRLQSAKKVVLLSCNMSGKTSSRHMHVGAHVAECKCIGELVKLLRQLAGIDSLIVVSAPPVVEEAESSSTFGASNTTRKMAQCSHEHAEAQSVEYIDLHSPAEGQGPPVVNPMNAWSYLPGGLTRAALNMMANSLCNDKVGEIIRRRFLGMLGHPNLHERPE